LFGRRERKTPLQREPLAKLEDLRDDCIALFLDSGLTQKEIHNRGGPTPATISKWLYKETKFPRLDTIRAFLQVLGAEMVVMSAGEAQKFRNRNVSDRLGLSVSFVSKPRMPRKKAA
jgi:hypothetical protein